MNADADRTVIRLDRVVKSRAKGGQRFVLDVPRLTIRQGEFVAIVGESGCGKSTLLDLLALVLQPTEAATFELRHPGTGVTHTVPGLDERGRARLRRTLLGYVLQTGGLLPFLSVRQNILLPCRLNGQRNAERRVLALAERLGIAAQLAKKPAHLSGGQRQRAAIARALAHAPPLVLADEPTAAVDSMTAREIRDTFRELTRQMGVSLLMVTHDWALVEGVVDRRLTFEITRPEPGLTRSVCREEEGTPHG